MPPPDPAARACALPFEGLELPLVGERPRAGAEPLACVLLAHGAGGSHEHPRMRARATALVAAGFACWRFSFPYRARKPRGPAPPDRLPRLVAAYRAVASGLRARGLLGAERVLLGGHSLGARVASVLAAEGERCDGLLLLSYPLHPAGRPERERSAHLAAIAPPVFCAQGTRDALCERERLERVVAALPRPWTLAWIEEADHELALPARRRRALGAPPGGEPALEQAAAAAAAWTRSLPAARAAREGEREGGGASGSV